MSSKELSTGIRVRRMLGEKLQGRLRTSANPAVIALRARLGQPHVALGRISVIVPIYNVERFLRACLESLRVQSYPDIEVIMVNDGSPDGSVNIAQEYAKRDRRFKLISKENAGLGAARNTGIRAATGAYITFVDSDDAVTFDSYREMVHSLDRSGSDFVIGGVERWRSRATWRDDWVTRVHGRDQFQVRVEDTPEVTKDVFAWNKLFRADFFREQLGEFPEGILYEDQELTARAFTRSKSFDILEGTTYLWRMREDGTSITQGKLTDRDLRDRISVAYRVHEIYRDHADEAVYGYWKQKTAALDFSFYYRLSHRGSAEYWEMLVDFTRFLFEILSEADWARVPVQERILAALIAADNQPQTEQVINAQAQFPGDLPTTETDGVLRIDLARWGVAPDAVPQFVQVLHEGDSALRTGLQRVEWTSPGELSLAGFVYIDKVPADISASELRLVAVRSDGLETEVALERFVFGDDDIALPRTAYAEYPGSGVRAVLPVHTLLESPEQQISLRVETTIGGVHRVGSWLPQNDENSFRMLPSSDALGGTFDVRADRSDGVIVRRRESPVSISDFTVAGRQIRFTVTALERLEGASIRFVNLTMLKHVLVELPPLEAGSFTSVSTELPLRPRAWKQQFETVWAVQLLSGDGSFSLPYPAGESSELRHAEAGAVAIRPDAQGWLEIADSRWAAVVHSVSARENSIIFTGTFDSQTPALPRLVMVRVDGTVLEQDSFNVNPTTREFSVAFALDKRPTWGVPFVPTTTGVYGLCVMPADAVDPFASSLPLKFHDRSVVGHRSTLVTDAGRVEVTDFGFERSVLLRLRGPLKPSEWSVTHNRRRLEEFRAEAMAQPLLPRVALCMSFSGVSVHDSPRPIAEQMLSEGLVDEVVWGVQSLDQDPGDGARVVAVHSEEFVDLLHRAKYLLNSAHFPHYARKREGQIYVQTWHGTPLKKIANDVPATSLSNQYRDLMSREVAAWDLLLAQSPEAGKLLTRAFEYDGPVLDSGYPRNDVFFDAERMQALRSRFRSDFGIGDGQTLVLYAPTWRDNSGSGVAGAGFEELDLGQVLDTLGPDARMLLRGHSNTRGFDRTIGDDRVLDVSGLSNLSAIIAASDMLITDYSSMFFDYFLTGKPVVGFVPDLETYSSSTRGLYFQYEQTFPGPIARTNLELLDLLRMPQMKQGKLPHIIEDVRSAEQGLATRHTVDWLKDEQ